jgi:hypothetical protein
VRIWQANIRKTIIAHMPITDGAVQEIGDFELDGVAFPAAEVPPMKATVSVSAPCSPPAIWWMTSKCRVSARSRPP